MDERIIRVSREELFDPNTMIAMQATVSGTASRSELEEAFYCAVSHHEVLGSAIDIDFKGVASYRPCKEPKNRIFYSTQSLENLIIQQERIRFEIENGEFLRLFINDTENDKIILTFLMHHCGGDGKSLVYFIESFLKALSGEKIEYMPMILLDPEHFPKASGLHPLTLLFVDVFNRRWAKEERIFSFEDAKKAFDNFWKCHRTQIEIKSIESKTMEEWIDQCHANHISFTSCYIALLEKENSSIRKIGIPISIRENRNRSMSNQVSAFQIRHHYNCGKSIIQNAVIIDKKMKKKISSDSQRLFALQLLSALKPTLVDATVLEGANGFHSWLTEKLARTIHYGENFRQLNDINISNLGKIDIDVIYGKFRIEDFVFIPPNVIYAKDVMGLISVNGKLSISHRTYSEK